MRILLSFLIITSPLLSGAQYTLHNVFGNLTDCDTMTRSIYVVWWDKDFDEADRVDVLLDSMISYRNTCLSELGMADPPNPEDGYYYNIYVHRPGNPDDIFGSLGWGNGQGTDQNGYPFLTLPAGVLSNWPNNAHEGFHIFQYNATSPGFAYSGNSQWYIEGSANWFAAIENITNPTAFVEAESLVRLPHVPLWLSYNNFPPSYPSNWQRYVHQYASALFLFYLTDVAGAPDQLITQGFFVGTDELPQQYLFYQIGGQEFRDHFIDWAAHITNHFDFISPVQATRNEQEWRDYADPEDDNEFIEIFEDSGTDGWLRPVDEDVTTAWSFNTYKVRNSTNGIYTFELEGDATGSHGDPSYFQGQLLIQSSDGNAQFVKMIMESANQGSVSIEATESDTAIYLIIASMPEVFGDDIQEFQTFSYEVRISAQTTGTQEATLPRERMEISRYNILGQPVDNTFQGVQIILYDDNSVEKILNLREW